MQNKLKVLSLGLLLAAGLGLTGCDDIEAKLPAEKQSQPILAIEGEAIPHNELEEIFEAVAPSSSDTASKTLNLLLYKLSESYFGTFYGENGLRAIVNDDAKIAAFVETHARFQIKNSAGERQSAAEIEGVKAFYNHIVTSIEKSFWSYVNNTTYQERSYFEEKKFYDAQKAALYEFDANGAYTAFKHVALNGDLDHKAVGSFFGNGGEHYLDLYQGYIERALIPDLYRTLLVENYLQRNNYLALGRSHARKVQTITLPNVSTSADATRDLITCYAANVLEGDAESIAAFIDNASITKAKVEPILESLRDLKYLSRIYSGTLEQADDLENAPEETIKWALAEKLYAAAGWEKDAVHSFYPLTTFGTTLKDYYEYSDVRWETSSTTDFTGSGAYTRETGLEIKQREAWAKTLVTEGWYTSSGLSTLPSEIRSRLFRYQVANDVDSNYGGDFAVIEDLDLINGVYRKGNYYLTPETYAAGTKHPYLIYDSSSSSWIIVRVDEAVKGSKLSTADGNTTSYDYLAGKGLRAGKQSQTEIVWETTELLGTGDSYVKAARQEVLKEANLKYHDQNVYDYFETTFPDLFD